MTTYRINVKTLNSQLLVFRRVTDYKVEGGYITFTDTKTGQLKRFATPNTEVEEER